MFKKLLIANRGEIAVRVARACREMGISPVAVYSDADRASLHVRVADQAIHIGPSPSNESYLVIDKIIGAAKKSGAEAIHPGYGFLSENAEFAEAVERSGLVLVGPPASAMKVMGSKTSARRTAQAAGVPVVPGTVSALESVQHAERAAGEIGYPVMLKAASGGGGKGLRLVNSREEIASAFSLASSEAAASFGDASVYIEKYIDSPRHIEIQLIGDRLRTAGDDRAGLDGQQTRERPSMDREIAEQGPGDRDQPATRMRERSSFSSTASATSTSSR